MEYAVIETGGKQYRVAAGDILEIDRIKNTSDAVSFEKVLLYVGQDSFELGKPYISGIEVKAKVLDNKSGKKIRVARFTAKSRHRRVVGFRPSLTRVQIETISKASKSATVTDASTKTTATKKTKTATAKK
ncbi:MAG TPA: 50S ribosomal protein L21 [Patescibacteria group bacterium]|nr:50S ribosomal protein L21 [Patescibacteria group bacterium]